MSELERPIKGDWLAAARSAMAAQKRYKATHDIPQEIYRCPICKDKEWVWNEVAQAMIPCKCRAERIMERRLQRAGISTEEYQKRNLDSFPTDREEAAAMKDLAIVFLANHKQGEGIIYTGKSGTMKTSILMAICLELTYKYGQEHKYFSYRDEMPVLKWLMFNKADEYQQRIKELINCDNLFIDDLFKSKKSAADTKAGNAAIDVSATDLQIMFQLVNGRYMNRKTTLFSSEYKLSQIITDVDEATGTRIYEMCRKYNMTCKDVNRRLLR